MKKALFYLKCSRVALACCFLFFFAFCKNSSTKSPSYKTALIERGDLASEITATGTLTPVLVVSIGTQVSGIVAKLFVDYNGIVRKGDLLAILDTTFLAASLRDAEASLLKSDAQLSLATDNKKRITELFEKGFSSKTDLDQALAEYKIALANRTSITSQLDRAKINLQYATVYSPIDGVVIARNVDVGQTVAASLSTPTLFKIATDLSAMQVLASIDEGDIGQVHKGQEATFTVDAYAERSFTGVVSQVRLEPTTAQNVVSYTVLIDVKNPDHLLMPGMTANITIATKSISNAFLVPSAALRFRPPFSKKEREEKILRTMKDSAVLKGSYNAKDSVSSVVHTNADNKGERGLRRGLLRKGAQPKEMKFSKPEKTITRGEFVVPDISGEPIPGRIFLLVNDSLKMVRISVLLNNGTTAAIEGDLSPANNVVVSTKEPLVKKNAAKPTNPFAAQPPPGGMGRNFR